MPVAVPEVSPSSSASSSSTSLPQDSSSSSNPASLRSNEGVAGHWRNPPETQNQNKKKDNKGGGGKPLARFPRVVGGVHRKFPGYRSASIRKTFLMTLIRNILRKWHPGSTVLILTYCKRTKMTRAPCRRRTGEPVLRATQWIQSYQ